MRLIKLLFVFLIGITLLSSCKKDKNAPLAPFFININGAVTNFTSELSATKATLDGENVTIIKGTASDKTTLSLTLYGSVTDGQIFSYLPYENIRQLLVGLKKSDGSYLNYRSFNLTVDSVSLNEITGTFEGEAGTGSVNDPKFITIGKFKVAFVGK